MTPYYEDDLTTLYCGTWEDVLPTLPKADLIFTSPPYNLGPAAKGSEWSRLSDGYSDHGDNLSAEDYQKWQWSCIRTMWAALTETGAIFYNHKPRVKGNRGWFPFGLVPPEMPIRQVVTWDRGSGFMRVPTFYVPSYEWIFVIAKEAFRLTSLTVDDVWRIPFETGSKHPAPFPVALPSRAIDSTSPGLVIDPYAGSGTTLVASKRAGVPAIGIEKSEAYCELAVSRLAQGALAFG